MNSSWLAADINAHASLCTKRLGGGRKQETKEDTEWGWECGLVHAAREDDRWQQRLLPICILCVLLDVFQVKANSQSTTPKQKGQKQIFLEANDPLDGDLAGENLGKFGDVLQEWGGDGPSWCTMQRTEMVTGSVAGMCWFRTQN